MLFGEHSVFEKMLSACKRLNKTNCYYQSSAVYNNQSQIQPIPVFQGKKTQIVPGSTNEETIIIGKNLKSQVQVNISTTSNLRRTGISVYLSEDLLGIKNYNFFIKQYNTEENMIGDIILKEIPNCSCLLMSLNRKVVIVLGICIFIPYLQFISLAYCLYVWVSIILCIISKQKNSNALGEHSVFEKMLYKPAWCKRLKKTNCYFEMDLTEMSQTVELTNDYEILVQRKKESTVSFMIYDDSFRSYYNNGCRITWIIILMILWIIFTFSTILVFADQVY